MKKILMILAMTATLSAALFPLEALARGGSKSKVQEVNFEEMTMKGTIRNPEGTFLVQKKGLKFLPLYQVQKDMDSKIRESEPDEVLSAARRTK